jgi:hypothetical protein
MLLAGIAVGQQLGLASFDRGSVEGEIVVGLGGGFSDEIDCEEGAAA